MNDEWKEPADDDGVTLGPEEALAREISRSKALKVERLKLRDRVEKLEGEVARLDRENQILRQTHPSSALETNTQNPENVSSYENSPAPGGLPVGWGLSLLAFNVLAVGILLWVLLQRS